MAMACFSIAQLICCTRRTRLKQLAQWKIILTVRSILLVFFECCGGVLYNFMSLITVTVFIIRLLFFLGSHTATMFLWTAYCSNVKEFVSIMLTFLLLLMILLLLNFLFLCLISNDHHMHCSYWLKGRWNWKKYEILEAINHFRTIRIHKVIHSF